MRNIKQFAVCLLAAGTVVLFAGCGSKSTATETTTAVETTTAAETTTVEATTTAEVTTTETSAEESTAAAESQKTQATELTGQLFDNQFSIEGNIYTLPLNVKDLQGLGFAATKADDVLNAKQMTSGRLATDKGEELVCGFYNLGTERITLSDAMISSINFKKKNLGDMQVTLIKGITFGSTLDEAKAAFGEPTTVEEPDPNADVMREHIIYKNPDDSDNFYDLYFEDKVLVGIQLYVREK